MTNNKPEGIYDLKTYLDCFKDKPCRECSDYGYCLLNVIDLEELVKPNRNRRIKLEKEVVRY